MISRIMNKWLRFYRKKVFQKHTSNHKNINILGPVYLNVPYKGNNLVVGNNVTIYPGVYFWGNGEIRIGNNVNIGKDTIIYAKESVVIGDNTNIAAQCYIIDSDHGTKKGIPIASQEDRTQRVFIGNDVWLSANVTVLAGSCIEDGAVIGAKALVKGHIEKDAIAVGIPAHVKGYRKE